jgi:ppGpp synthetase/RelA/SpoT-type nucleotidyltranferase
MLGGTAILAYDNVIREYERRKDVYDEFGKAAAMILKKGIEQGGIKYHSIYSRPKDPKKLKRKLERAVPPYTNPLEQVTDLAGVRVIAYFTKDVDEIAKVVAKSFSVDWPNSVDKRAALSPDRFGYASLQYVIQLDTIRSQQVEYERFAGLKCEIQMPTILQHAWSEIEHDLEYKSEIDVPGEIRRRFAALSALLEIADREFEAIRREEGEIRKRVVVSLSEDRLKIPIDMVSLQEYLKDKIFDQHRLAEIPPAELSDLIADIRAMGINDIEALDSAIGRFDLDIGKLEKKLEVLTGYDIGLHPAGMIRIVLARAFPEQFQDAMAVKLARTEGRIREFNSRMTSAILKLVGGS